jgi:hypothetical protein
MLILRVPIEKPHTQLQRRASASEAAVSASKSAAEAAVLAAAEVRTKLDSEVKKSLALQVTAV